MRKPERCSGLPLAKYTARVAARLYIWTAAPAPLRLFLPQAAPQLRSQLHLAVSAAGSARLSCPPPIAVPPAACGCAPIRGLGISTCSLTRQGRGSFLCHELRCHWIDSLNPPTTHRCNPGPAGPPLDRGSKPLAAPSGCRLRSSHKALRLTAAAQPKEEGAAAGSEPPYGGGPAGPGEHLRAVGLRSRAAACGRNRRGGAGAAAATASCG